MKIRVSLSRWRERVRVRVERSGFPLTSRRAVALAQRAILSPEGERRFLLGYFLINYGMDALPYQSRIRSAQQMKVFGREPWPNP